MSVIRRLVMQEVSLGLNLPAIFYLIWPGLLYAHANTTTSDEHSIVTVTQYTYYIVDCRVRHFAVMGAWPYVEPAHVANIEMTCRCRCNRIF